MKEWTKERLEAGDNALDALHEALRRKDPSRRARVQRKPRPIDTTPAEIAETSEMLASMTVAGVVHAAYPSATASLCGLRRGATELDARGPVPDCHDCLRTSAHFAVIDGSAPKHWKDALAGEDLLL